MAKIIKFVMGFLKKCIDIGCTILYNIITGGDKPNRVGGKAREENKMDDMNQAEVLRDETEQKMLYKFLLMISESESLEELKEKVEALIKK